MNIQGKQWLAELLGNRDIFVEVSREQVEKPVIENLLSLIESILLNGTQLILDKVFDFIGFDRVDDEILRHLEKILQVEQINLSVDKVQGFLIPLISTRYLACKTILLK